MMPDVLHPLLDDLIRIAVIALIGAGFAWLRGHVRGQALAVARRVAADAVRFAHQVGAAKGLSGPARFTVAADAAASLAAKMGVRLPAADWKTVIEAAYSDAKPLLAPSNDPGTQAAANARAAATPKS